MSKRYDLPSHVEESFTKIVDIIESMCNEHGDKEGFADGVLVGLNLALTTITEMAYENWAKGSSEQDSVLSVGRELISLMKEL